MKPVLMSDAIALARVLRAAPEERREKLIREIFTYAEEAFAFSQRHGRTHPIYGNGSAMAASATFPQVAEPTLEDRMFCRCLMQIFDYLSAH